jgi:hypothetical protein
MVEFDSIPAQVLPVPAVTPWTTSLPRPTPSTMLEFDTLLADALHTSPMPAVTSWMNVLIPKANTADG